MKDDRKHRQGLQSCGRMFMLALLLTGGLLSSCTQDELADNQGEPLPPGQYPLELTAGGLQAVATPAQTSTRGTVDGDWDDVQSVMVQDGEKASKAYNVTVKEDKKTATLSCKDPFWWTSTGESKDVRAWYSPNKEMYQKKMPTTGDSWTVATGQSVETFKSDDFLYAYKKLNFNDNNKSLEFNHLLSKIIINIEETTYLGKFKPEEISVSLEDFSIEGLFENKDNLLTLVENPDKDKQIVTPFRLTDNAYAASFEALVIPQDIRNTERYIKVKVGEAVYSWKITDETISAFSGGHLYTYNVKVNEQGLDVTVEEESIGWNTGKTGNGEVEVS